MVDVSVVGREAVVRDLRTADPSAHLWVAIANVATDVPAVCREDAEPTVFADLHVSVIGDFVQRLGERVDEAAHVVPAYLSPTHSESFACNQRTLASW